MKKKVLIFWLSLVLLIVSSIGIANAKTTIPMSDVDVGGEISLGEIQTSGVDKFTDSAGEVSEIDYDSLRKETDNLAKTLEKCNIKFIDCDARCGSIPVLPFPDKKKYECYMACGQEQGDAEVDYSRCRYSISGIVSAALGTKEYKYSISGCPEFLEYTNKIQAEEDACLNSCPKWTGFDDKNYDGGLCANKCGVRWIRKDQAWVVCSEVKAALKAHEYFEKWFELVTGEKIGDNNQNTENNLGSFNTNSNRGRDEFGRINPSFGGYLGDAYVIRSDGTKVIPGKELYLKVEDRIVTGANSKLNFIFKDVGGINLGENTELRVGNALLDQYYLARGTLKTQLNWGTLPPQKLEFHTPNAVILTKGTEFVVDYNETTNITLVYLNEGILEININDERKELTAGNYLIIYPDGTTKTNQLESEKWTNLGNNFYETSDVGKSSDNRPFLIVVALVFVVIIILSLWLRKKQKR